MSSGTTFDPSREWLGIDAVDLADPRRVLGLPAGRLDRDMVGRAAEERLARLRGFDPGPFTIAHKALVTRVEQCRDELLASLPVLSASGFAPPPPPGAAMRPQFPLPSAGQPAPRPGGERRPGPPPSPPPAPAQRPAAAPAGFTTNDRPPAPKAPRADTGRRGIRWLPVVALLAAAACLFAYRDQLRPQGERLIAAARDRADEFRELVSSGGAAENDPTSNRPVNQPSEPPPAAPPRPTMVEGPTPVPVPPPVSPPDESQPPPPEPEPQPVPTTPSPPLPVPPPSSGEKPVSVTPGQLDELLAAARAALVAGDFDTADARVARARDLVGGGPGADRVAGWEQLVQHARRFAFFRDKALAAAAGRDFDVGDKRISVVEVTNRLFIFRHEGYNRRVPIDEIPEAIVMTLTKKWFAGGGQAANHLFVGARYLSRPEPDAAAARKAWLAAQQGGEDVSLLLPLLDDPVLRAAPPRRRRGGQ